MEMSLKYSICAAFILFSATSAAAQGRDWAVSIDCNKLKLVGDTIRATENTMVVDANWSGYSLSAGQTIGKGSEADGGSELFQMIEKSCNF